MLKSLAIENDWDIPEELQAFVDQHPELIGELEVLSRADQAPSERVHRTISEYTTFLFESTFINKPQLEGLLKGFDKGAFGPGPFTFYIPMLLISLERWTELDSDGMDYSYGARSGFDNHDEFIDRLIHLVETEKIILHHVRIDTQFVDSRTGEYPEGGMRSIEDEYWQKIYPRSWFTRVRYNREKLEFYPETDIYKLDLDDDIPTTLNEPGTS